MEITRLSPHFAARVDGLELSGSPGDALIETLETLLSEHLLLVLPRQHLNPTQLRDFTAHFGPLFVHHADKGVIHAEGVPEVLEMRKEPDGARLFGGSDWHADITFRSPAGRLSVLQAVTLPPVGGDTLFANTIAACQALSSGLRETLRNLVAVHSYDGRGQPDHPTETARHPVIRRHPRRDTEGLYLNRMFATRFEGFEPAESEPLIDYLDRHMSRPEFCCRVRWEPGHLLIWDNRFTLHYPANDFTDHLRLLIRCSAMETG